MESNNSRGLGGSVGVGVALLATLVISLLYGDGSWVSFLLPALAMIVLGSLGFWTSQLPATRVQFYVVPKDILLSVTVAWMLAALLGGVP